MTTTNDPWQTPMDDSYWQALLEDGERTTPFEVTNWSTDVTSEDITSALVGEAPPELEKQAQASTHDQDWERSQAAFEQGQVFTLEVTGFNRGGLLVRSGGLQGFIPASQLVHLPNHIETEARKSELARRVGETLTLRIIELDQERNRLIFSERAAQSLDENKTLDDLAEGDILQGHVTHVCGFGAFVDLGGVEGLIHISELSWGRVNHPSDILSKGQAVQVYVLGVEQAQHRVALSLKRLKPNPWSMVDENYEIGQIVNGTITNVVNFGAFARIEDGLEGLIHISELAEGNFLHPRNVVREGDQVKVKILNIDSRNHRLGLSMRQARQDMYL